MLSIKKGFSLIELLIVITIMGVLLTLALPSYSEHYVRVHRLSAETALMKLAGQMEMFFARHNTYEGATLAALDTDEWIAEKNYRLLINSVSDSHFELTAIPENQQAKRDKTCGVLSLDSRGIKKASLAHDLKSCW